MSETKFIVRNRSSIPDAGILCRVAEIIRAGLISKTARGPQYCFATTFADGIVIYASRNEKSHVFTAMADVTQMRRAA